MAGLLCQCELSAELAKQLRDPTIAVTPRAYAPEQIYVGGQVGQPGTYTMPNRIGALEANGKYPQWPSQYTGI